MLLRPFVHTVLAVLRKELLDGFRDRRSLTSALTFALVGPLVVAMALDAVAQRAQEDRPLVVRVAGAERTAHLVEGLETRGATLVRTSSAAAVEAAVRSGEATVGLILTPDHDRSSRRFRPAPVIVVEDRSRGLSRRDSGRLREFLQAWAGEERERRLLARGVSPRAFQPLELQARDLSSSAARAAGMLATVPIFLLMATFVGGMNTAIDVTAGERERGSLETLLLFPAPRGAVATGKWLAAAVPNLVVVMATLAAMVVVIRWPRLDLLDLRLGVGPGGLLVALAILAPLVLLGPAAQMLASLFSRTFREAQAWVSMLVLVPALPGFVFAFQEVEAAGWMEITPFLGHQLALSALLRGEMPAPDIQLLLAAGTLALAIVCVVGVGSLFGRERLVTGG